MKADRRSFFKFGAGAIASAPVAMKQVESAMLGHPVGSGLGKYASGLVNEVPSGGDHSWMKQEISEITAKLARVDETKPLHERHWSPVIAQRIDGLRSVSPVNRARMMVEASENLARVNERSWMQRHIAELKKRLGPLGDLL